LALPFHSLVRCKTLLPKDACLCSNDCHSHTMMSKTNRAQTANSKSQIVGYVRMDLNTNSIRPKSIGTCIKLCPVLPVVLWPPFSRAKTKPLRDGLWNPTLDGITRRKRNLRVLMYLSTCRKFNFIVLPTSESFVRVLVGRRIIRSLPRK